MATLPRGLCVLVTLWLAWSHPSAANRAESSHSAQWWGSEKYSQIEKAAQQLRAAGNFPELERVYQRGIQQARADRNVRAQISYLTALGNTYLYLYQYAEAISAYAQARALAEEAGDWIAAGAIAPGLSSAYYLVGDWAAAKSAVDQGLGDVSRAATHPYYEAQLQLQYARLHAGGADTSRILTAAIDAARGQTNVSVEAEAWDLLGEAHSQKNKVELAEAAFSEAHRLRLLHAPRELRLSYWRIGAFRLTQGRLDEAERFTEAAIAANQQSGGELSAGTLLHQRGKIRLARGDVRGALVDLDAATRSAERWRAYVPPPARSSLTAADTTVDSRIARTFIETAAHHAIVSGNARWAELAFLTAERNRAGSLRQSTELGPVWRRKLPPEYWATLARIRAAESKSLLDPGLRAQAERLHFRLSEMEAAAGLGYSPNILENFRTQSSLTLFQQGLSDSELFLGFYTGASESYLWAVTRSSVHLYRLPAADRLSEIVRQFQRALYEHHALRQGEEAYDVLFGQLTPQERRQARWLMSLEGPLFQLPFAALRNDGQFLVEQHSLQVTPSAALLGTGATVPRRRYLGIADPIYNAADDRLPPARTAAFEPQGQLNRLVASTDEVQRSAQAWGGSSTVLSGQNATRLEIVGALSNLQPSAVHFATHVVAGEAPSSSFLALSLGPGGSPELLGVAEIAMLRVPRSLIVMTGCSSGAGEVRAGAGLLGLTRAWLAAGATAVLATQWTVEDAGGDLLPSFYRHISSVPAAEALRRGQVEMLHSGTWQADPMYWAAFQLTGVAR